ncbi:MAG TPA: tetratricopeptide repeat protein [Steroidobacteraceae bacterium]
MVLRTSPRRQVTVAAWAAAVAVFSSVAGAEETARYRPADGDAVVLALPAGVSAAQAMPADAGDPERAAIDAEAFLRLARTTRDARYFGRAEALVEPWIARQDATPRLLVAAADLAQQRHDFANARQLLDRAIGADPGDGGARMQRANVALLLGDYEAARRDCLAVLQSGATFPGTVCLASTMTGPGSLQRARRLLTPLDDAGPAAPDIARWLLLTESDLALRDGDARAARDYLARAHALDPDHEETRARLAELLIEQGDAAGALTLARGSTVSAALLVRRIRAAAGIDAGEAASARRELDALLAVGRLRGTTPHLREEGELALFVDRDAARALALARQNFALQKDTPDVRLLLGAAVAAGDKPTLAELRRWLASTGFEDRVVSARLKAVGA